MAERLAIVYCAHHKPWLMMSTLLTTLIQDRPDTDLFIVYNVGDGASDRPAYQEYRRVAAHAGVNPQLSPFDERVREVCRLRRDRVVELEYENDHTLDSGVWYKFIRDGRWREYDRVLFLGEGALLAHPRALDALVDFTRRREVHFVASGHEQRRVPRARLERWAAAHASPTDLDVLHEQMIRETFAIFCRDPEFRAVFDRWGSDFPPETRHHVPPVALQGPLLRRVRDRAQRQFGSPHATRPTAVIDRAAQAAPFKVDEWASRASLWTGQANAETEAPPLVNDDWDVEHGVAFHREAGPEWFGCTVLHLFSREFLERFSAKLDAFHIYDALDLPFAGTPLEVIWGLLPAWIGVDKWFTNGLHRVRKHFAMYQREDFPPEMAGYINRYHRGRLVVGWQGDFLKLKAWQADLGDLRRLLPAPYFL
jgi:hypothetical protein